MLAPTTGRWRTLRAGAFALIAAQISVLGHVVAGGSSPDLTLLVAMTALLAASLRALGGQRRTFPALLGAMVATQVVFHLILTLAGARHTMAAMTQPHDDYPLRMFVFHAIAAGLTAAMLAYGERVLFTVHSWVSRLLPRTMPALVVPARPTWTVIADRAGENLRFRLAFGGLSRRGPPAAFASAT